MPIRLLSLSVKDIRYALQCMDICDLIALSLCSKRTKNLVKCSNRKVDRTFIYLDENYIRFEICETIFHEDDESISFYLFDRWVELDSGDREESDSEESDSGERTQKKTVEKRRTFDSWRKEEFTQGDWIAHFLSIFNESMAYALEINDISLPYLDTVKQFIPKCQTLRISPICADNVAKIAFRELSPIIKEVEIEKNIFDDKTDISQFLTSDLRSLSLVDFENPFKVTLDDLLAINITDLSIEPANITVKELNQFVRLTLSEEIKQNRQEAFKGIKYQTVNECLLVRGDGKELLVSISVKSVVFEFRV
ncbi:hypothetical protein B9Z55_021573 [Caenorhabditis nigoni]|uniref:F-box domain-containing protein n=1 Tax=Caenorhabditis nigoni TaxID=1611254 RepID=A0A2G5TSJ2_9PELO|nr:hypothetical protein B9Z55_021573 [Caenorhabditis nigoni]